MAQRTETFQTDPVSIGARGEAVARDRRRRPVYITGAIPGEQVRAVVLAERPTYVRARLAEVLAASPHRADPWCPEIGQGCGGCPWQHLTLPGQQAVKDAAIADTLRRALGEDASLDPAVALPDLAYRTTLRAAVSAGRAGYRRARAHSVVAVSSCGVAHPLLEDLLVNGRFATAEEVVLRCGARTGERLAAPLPEETPIAVPADVARDHFHEIAAGRRWRISAQSFFQSRPDGADALASLVLAAAGAPYGAGRAVDLYSGVGLYAGALADLGWHVRAVETSTAACADARINLGPDAVVQADVEAWPPEAADFLVANPSRRGLGPAGAAAVLGTGAARVALVSCDLAALGRDAGLLSRAGFALARAIPVDMFPYTFHVEVVSIFAR